MSVMVQKKQRKIDKKRKDVLQQLTRVMKILDALGNKLCIGRLCSLAVHAYIATKENVLNISYNINAITASINTSHTHIRVIITFLHPIIVPKRYCNMKKFRYTTT